MKHKTRRPLAVTLIVALLIAMLATPIPASAAPSPETDFSFNSGTITLYTGPDTDVEIPATIGGVSVTAIGNSAFSGNTSLTSVIVPNSVMAIGEQAFAHCTSLTSVVISDGVTVIEQQTFMGCTSLASVTIPDSVTVIGLGAFQGCTGLTSVVIPGSVTDIQQDAFHGCSSLISVNIPVSVATIGREAFCGCSIASVNIPNGVAVIENGAFAQNTSLTSVTIPDSVTTIEPNAFSGCTGLTSVTIPDRVTSIGYWAFKDCINLSKAIFKHANANTITSFGTVSAYVFDGTAAGFAIYYPYGATGFTNPWNGYPTVADPSLSLSSSTSSSTTTNTDTLSLPNIIISHDGESKNTNVTAKEAAVSEPPPSYLTPITPPVEVNWTSADDTALIYLDPGKGTSGAQPLYVMMQYVDGHYEFLDVAYSGGTVTTMLNQGDVVQLLRLDAGEVADFALPGYVPLDFLVYMTNKLNGKITEYDGVTPDPAGAGTSAASGIISPGSTLNKSLGISDIQIVPLAAAVTFLANDYTQSKYDPRGLTYFPTVKDQKTTSLCWDFSAISAVEASLGKQNNQQYDLSESNAAFALSYEGKWGFQRGVTDGGNFKMLMSYLTRLDGPVLESADPFSNVLEGRSVISAAPVAYVTDFVQVPNSVEQVKRYIVDSGSVVTSMHMGDGKTSESYNAKTNAYFIEKMVIPNHAVQIVGWDDGYSKNNFSTKPPVDGAWIVKNSWGEKHDDKGYIYVSYADSLMQRTLYAVPGVSHTGVIDHMYLVDPFGEIGKITYNSNDMWFSNVFTKQEAQERLSAVSFYSSNEGVSYEVWVSTTGKFTDKERVKTGTLSESGYHTVELDNQIMLESSDFAVFVKLSSSKTVSASVQKNMDGYLHKAVSEPGRSFVSADGEKWMDISERYDGAHVCLRAMTVSGSRKPAYVTGYPDKTFRPDNNISRAEVASLISKALELAPGSASSFNDVDKNSWYLGYVSALEQKGCFDRLGSSFDSSAIVTREDFSYILCKALDIEPDSADSGFPDISGSYAKAEIQALYALGIITGYPDGTFKPSGSVTRAEMVSLVNRATSRTQAVPQVDSLFKDVKSTHWAFADIVRASR